MRTDSKPIVHPPGGGCRLLAGLALLALGCGDDTPAHPGPEGGVAADAAPAADGAGPVDGAAADDAVATGDAAGGDGPGADAGPPWEPPPLAGRVYAGHYLTASLRAFDGTSLTEITGSPVALPTRLSDLVALPGRGFVAVPFEGDVELRVYDGATLEEVPGSPYATAIAPEIVVFDEQRHLMVVFCLDDDGGPASLVTVYDTTSVPFTEVAGSPFAIDVTPFYADLDPLTGRIVAVGFTKLFAFDLDAGGLTHALGSPIVPVLDGQFAGLAVDPQRRRLYTGEIVVPGAQKVHAFDLDTLQPVAGSPVSVPGSSFAGDVAVNPLTGDVFFVDAGARRLHSLAPGPPLTVRDTCGTGGCPTGPTETGLVVDYTHARLFMAELISASAPDTGAGFLAAWDISDPESPTKLADSPRLDVYPIYLGLE